MALKRPIDLDERMIEHHGRRNRAGKIDDPLIAGLAGAVRLAREQADRLVHLERAALADRSQSEEAALLQVANAASRMGERVGASLDTARGAVQSEIEKITRRTASPPPPKTTLDAQLEQEVRARLAAMPENERIDAISKAITEGNDMIAGAVLRAPAFLTGLGEARLEAMRHKYRERFHADDMARMASLKSALDATDRSGKSFVSIIRAATAAPAVQLAVNAKQKREEALAAAKQPVQGK